MTRSIHSRAFLLLLLLPAVAACSRTATTIGAAGAAAAAAIAYNDRGATTNVDISVSRLADATEAAFRDLGITLTERESQEDGIELKGTDGEWKVVVDIERDADEVLTSAEVTVSRNEVDYSQSRAEQILRTILNRAS
ncbi:MAG TPA: DUF3568 family protein [Longimicrobiales bacterium]